MAAFKKEIKEMVQSALEERKVVDSRPVPSMPRPIVRERTFAVVVKGDAQKLESGQVKEKVLKEVGPKVSVRVRSIRNVKEGIEILTRTEAEAELLRKCEDFGACGLKVESPRVPRPKVLFDVPKECKDEDLIQNIIERKLREGGLEENEFTRQITVVNRAGRGPTQNIVCELPEKCRRALLREGRIYWGFNSCRVVTFTQVPRCYVCQGFGHGMRDCPEKKRRCWTCGGQHLQAECKGRPDCINCRKKGLNSGHRTDSVACPEYQRRVLLLKERAAMSDAT